MHLDLKLFGSLVASITGEPVTHFRSDKARALLAYLAMNPGRPFRRETLATLLWPDWPDKDARRNLRQTLHRLRQMLAVVDSRLAENLILTSRQTAQLDVTMVQLDVVQFHEHLQACETHHHIHLQQCSPCLDRMQKAAELYQGELMQGFGLDDAYPFEEWLFMQREQLQQQMLELLETLAEIFEKKGEYSQAQRYANRQVMLAPWRESAHQKLMRLYMLQGQRSAALAQYESACLLLEQELGVEPSAETVQLWQQIKDGSFRIGSPVQTAVHDFPMQLTPFIGRKWEIAQIMENLADESCHILTLIGPGGMGKTRLSIQVGQELRATGQGYKDGAYFIPLASVSDRVMLVTTIAQHLGLRLAEQATPRRQLLNFLQGKELLLVCDNFEHLINEAELLTDIAIAAPDTKILVTSRQPLNLQAEWRQVISGLDFSQGSKSEAVRFFQRNAQRSNPQFRLEGEDMMAVIDLCHLVDGMPLALEIAASWTRMMDCRTILRETQKSLDFLTSPLGDLPERHQSLRAVLTQSWGQLTAHLQSALSQLAQFAGGFTLESALEIMPDLSLLDIATLLDRSLLQWQPNGRYQMHELLRQFAQEQSQGETPGFQENYSSNYLSFVAEQEKQLLGKNPRQAIEVLQKELDNLRQAWRWAIDLEDTSSLNLALNAMSAFYEYRGMYEEGSKQFSAAAQALPTSLLGNRLRLAEASFRQKLGDMDSAEMLVEEVLASDFPETKLAALIALARLNERRSNYDQAIAILQEALALSGPNSREAAQIWTILGAVYAYRGPMEERIAAHKQALAVNMALEDDLQTAECHVMLSMIYKDSGSYAEAINHMEQALEIANEINHRESIGRFTQKLGVIYWRMDDLDRSHAYYEQALAIVQEINHKRLTSLCLGSLGVLAKRRRQYDQALRYYWQAVHLAEEMEDKSTHAVYLGNIGNVYMDLGQYDKAVDFLMQAAALDRAVGAWGGVARHYGNIGDCLKFQRLFAEALPYFEEAVPHLRQIGSNYFLCWVLVSYAECLFELGRKPEAQKANDEGGAIAAEIGRDFYELSSILLNERLHPGERDIQELESQFQYLRERFPAPDMLAEIDYVFWLITGSAAARVSAEKRFMGLYEQTKIMRYRTRITA